MPTCPTCSEPFERRSIKGRPPTFCPPCQADKERARARRKAAGYRARNVEAIRQKSEELNRRIKEHRAGLVSSFLARQGGGCAICWTRVPGGRHGWHLDHDHSCCAAKLSLNRCGKCERGVLCGVCNQGIGLLGDSPTRLVRAAQYLRSSS